MGSVEALCVFWCCLILFCPKVLLVLVFIVISPFMFVLDLLHRWKEAREDARLAKERIERREKWYELRAQIRGRIRMAQKYGKNPVGIILDYKTREFVYQCQEDWFERLENPAKVFGLTIHRAAMPHENLSFIYE